MINKIKLLLSIFCLISLTNCSQNTKMYSFKDITGKGATKLKLVLKAVDRHYKDNNDIKWNFTKFLVDREGNVVQRFEPTEDLGDVKEAIKALL